MDLSFFEIIQCTDSIFDSNNYKLDIKNIVIDKECVLNKDKKIESEIID